MSSMVHKGVMGVYMHLDEIVYMELFNNLTVFDV